MTRPSDDDVTTLRGERCTEALDTADADLAFRDVLGTTHDPLAAAVLVAAVLIADAIREAAAR